MIHTDYNIDNNAILGEGLAKVVCATHVVTGDVKAAKLVNISNDGLETFYNEAQILQYLNSIDCKNIVRLVSSSIYKDTGIIIMERLERDLLDLVLENSLSLSQKKEIFRQICNGVKECHDNGIAHLDIKPENVLVNISNENNFTVKLVDFGASQHKDNKGMVYRVRGTIHYNAPEVFSQTQNGVDGNAADIWSLGILFHVLFTGTWPVQTDNPEELRSLLTRGSLHMSSLLSKEQTKFLQSILLVNPARRPNIDKILQSSYLFDGRRKKSKKLSVRRLFSK